MTVTSITLLRSVPTPKLLALLALMLGSALTEGAGIIALVPMLSLLSADVGNIPSWARPLASHVTLNALLAFFVGLVAVRAVLQYAVSVQQRRLQLDVIDHWRTEIFSALVRADWRTLSAQRTSDHASLIVMGVDRLGFGFANLLILISGFATLAAIWIAALWLSPLLALVAVGGGLLVLAAFGPLRRRAHLLGERLGDDYRRVQAVLDDTLRAIRLVKSHGRESTADADMRRSTQGLRDAQIAFTQAAGRSRVLLHAGAALLLAGIVALASVRGIAPAVLLPLIVLFARSVPLLDSLQQAAQQWVHAAPALTEAQSLLKEMRAAEEATSESAEPIRPSRSIFLDTVTVHHPGREHAAVENVSLDLAVNTTTVLLGPSGAGKSTLADLFGGLLVPDEGAVGVDGQPLPDQALIGWRGSVAYVHQEPVLFHGTVRENMLWAEPDASEEAIERALRTASASFVFDLPDGIETVVGDAGRQLSGGERQRIALARALLRDPALLILDEATSALDTANEAAIVSAVEAMKGTRTILVIAHRGKLAEAADTLVHMRDGRIETIEQRA
ncbi:ABC transporter ATP-binding protein [Croceicoccus gelatinilyticus]|uniref:ABC transporter ATP-binding protein n=1 Tax=Croceicoccus gelatinilyticus TaxID=2835536 RepID=UPI001BCA8842|nr:ABC transporter ATP-binding protein [Croceicoccus gelatinilyticus]MBS7669495.1 ABC transporter ATP-binding protein [Croceicoccus gelatinilyticus]